MDKPHTFFVYSRMNEGNIAHSVGMPEYSYYFVLRDFVPMLQRIGDVHLVSEPEQDVDRLFAEQAAQQKQCLFLNFSAPHNMLEEIRCPTVHVFAWEYDTIPTESWLDDEKNDWRYELSRHRAAITHSQYASDAIKDEMGADFPVGVIPCPVWDRFEAERKAIATRSPTPGATLRLHGRILDTRRIACLPDLEDYQRRGKIRPAAPTAAEINLFSVEQPFEVKLDGVVYTSIFNPLDGRKNWQDMMSAFIWAHKTNQDATLVIKTPKLDVHDFVEPLMAFLKRFSPFDCRIVVLMAFLDDQQYRGLLNASAYYLNASVAEGQCLPLMEYLSAGVPALAPATTALADYITSEISFVVPAHAEPTNWQHDPRFAYRAIRYRPDWLKLVDAFKESRHLAKTDPAGWRRLGAAAARRMERHCSLDAAEARMRAFLHSKNDADAHKTGDFPGAQKRQGWTFGGKFGNKSLLRNVWGRRPKR